MRFVVEGVRRRTGEEVAFEFEAASPSHAEAELVRRRIRWNRLDWVPDEESRPAQHIGRWAWYVLRWIAVLPAGAFGGLLLAMVMLLLMALGSDVTSWWALRLLGAGFVGWSFIVCATFTAPHARRQVCITLVVLVFLAVVGATALSWHETTWFEVVQRVVLVLAAMGAINTVEDVGVEPSGNLPWKRTSRRQTIDRYRFEGLDDDREEQVDDDEDETEDDIEDYGNVPDWPLRGPRRVWVPAGASAAFTAIAIPVALNRLDRELYNHYLVERLTWGVTREGWTTNALREHAEEVVSCFGTTSELATARDIRDLIFRIVTSVPGQQALSNAGVFAEPMDVDAASTDYVASIEETSIDAWLIELEPTLRD